MKDLNNAVAVSVALLSAFMAVTRVKDDNVVQRMQKAKADAVDTWAEYQGKRVRHQVLLLGRDLARTKAKAREVDETLKTFDAAEQNLKVKARGFEDLYEALDYRDDQFDLSTAILSVSISMLAVAALTRKPWLLWLSWVFGVFGVALGLAGLLGWGLHPDFLTRPLS